MSLQDRCQLGSKDKGGTGLENQEWEVGAKSLSEVRSSSLTIYVQHSKYASTLFSFSQFLAPAVLAQPGALEMVSVSEWVSESVANFFCLNDQAYNCLIHLQSLSVYSTCVYAAQTVHTGIEQVCWHECRHCSWLLSGDDWQVRVGIAVSRLQALDLLKETNNGRMS